ncbi:MAG: polysaccharide deacetylase family protein [Chloroflexota bacterium]
MASLTLQSPGSASTQVDPAQIRGSTAFRRSIRSKGLLPFLRRLGLISQRFGWTTSRIEGLLAEYYALLETHNVPAVWNVTGDTAVRNPDVVRKYSGSLVEIGIHGWSHTDHQLIDNAAQALEVDRGIQAFESIGVPTRGWRCPYLRAGQGTLARVAQRGLAWEVSGSIELPMRAAVALDATGQDTWDRAIAFYGASPLAERLALPQIVNGTVHFFTSLPDDEMLIDRLSLPQSDLTRIWLAMLDRTIADGELLAMQLHPERIRGFKAPLAQLIERTRASADRVWIASLGDLADWWQARSQTRINAQPTDSGWRISAAAPHPVAIELLAPGLTRPSAMTAGTMQVDGEAWPGVGIVGAQAPTSAARLAELGFLAEPVTESRQYAAVLVEPSDSDLAAFARSARRGEGIASPLAHVAYWPAGFGSAMVITGDVCAMTLKDFAARVFGRDR